MIIIKEARTLANLDIYFMKCYQQESNRNEFILPCFSMYFSEDLHVTKIVF